MNFKTLGMFLLVSGACCGVNQVAAAQMPAPVVTCTTFSNGLNFQHDDRDRGLATQLVIQACQFDPRTNNQECSSNVACSPEGFPPGGGFGPQPFPPGPGGGPRPRPPFPPSPVGPQPPPPLPPRPVEPQPLPPLPEPGQPVVNCSTFSAGITFNHSGRDQNLTSQLAIQACQADSRTNNQECASNISCGNQIREVITCTTDSNGVNFSHGDLDENLARQLAVQSCQNDSRTNNQECASNSRCSNSLDPIRYRCSTFSSGVNFMHDGLSLSLTQQLLISSCQNDSRTNNQECAANVSCAP